MLNCFEKKIFNFFLQSLTELNSMVHEFSSAVKVSIMSLLSFNYDKLHLNKFAKQF